MRAAMCVAVLGAVAGCQSGSPAGPGDDAVTPRAGVTTAERAGDTLVGPYVHDNLAVYLVVNAAVQDARQFITLDEALAKGVASISERGGSEGRDDAEVNTLEVSNGSGQWLYIEAGEVVKGGKQDRTLGRDLLVAPGTKNQPLEAFCVEQGRWSARGTSQFAGASASIAPAAKIAILRDKSQQAVWDEVAKQREANDSEQSASGTYMDVVNDDQVQARLAPYLAALRGLAAGRADAIGCVIARDGAVVAADLYGAPGLFQALYPKLLAAHAREAALTRRGDASGVAAPAIDAVIAFLDAAEQGEVTTSFAGADITLRACENDGSIAFSSTEAESGKRLHYNALKK